MEKCHDSNGCNVALGVSHSEIVIKYDRSTTLPAYVLMSLHIFLIQKQRFMWVFMKKVCTWVYVFAWVHTRM